MTQAARRVLVISNDPKLRVAFAQALAAYDVRTADPALALEVLRAGDFGAIIYDVGTDRATALAFVQALSREERLWLLVVDAIHHDDELARLVASRTVLKPLSVADLNAFIALLMMMSPGLRN